MLRAISVLNMLNEENRSENADVFGNFTLFPNISRVVVQPK